MTDFTELVKLLTAMVSLLTALVVLSKALKQDVYKRQRLRWYLRCAALQGAKPRSGDTTEYAEALLAWAETYSQSGNAYI